MTNRQKVESKTNTVQSGAAYHSLGFEDENLGSSPGWWAATAASYCPSRPGNYPNSYLQNLANDRPLLSVHCSGSGRETQGLI